MLALEFSRDGRWLASGSDDGAIRLHRLESDRGYREAFTLSDLSKPVQRLRFSPDGASLFVLLRGETAVRTLNLAGLCDAFAALDLAVDLE